MRVAFVSPLPPAPTGIADYTADVIDALRDRFAIEAFHAQDAVDSVRLRVPVHPAATLEERHRERPFDAVVYQMGNAWCHDYMWPYLFKWPGLVVLHDAHLHHARAWSLLRRFRGRDYRAELAFNLQGRGLSTAWRFVQPRRGRFPVRRIG